MSYLMLPRIPGDAHIHLPVRSWCALMAGGIFVLQIFLGELARLDYTSLHLCVETRFADIARVGEERDFTGY